MKRFFTYRIKRESHIISDEFDPSTANTLIIAKLPVRYEDTYLDLSSGKHVYLFNILNYFSDINDMSLSYIIQQLERLLPRLAGQGAHDTLADYDHIISGPRYFPADYFVSSFWADTWEKTVKISPPYSGWTNIMNHYIYRPSCFPPHFRKQERQYRNSMPDKYDIPSRSFVGGYNKEVVETVVLENLFAYLHSMGTKNSSILFSYILFAVTRSLFSSYPDSKKIGESEVRFLLHIKTDTPTAALWVVEYLNALLCAVNPYIQSKQTEMEEWVADVKRADKNEGRVNKKAPSQACGYISYQPYIRTSDNPRSRPVLRDTVAFLHRTNLPQRAYKLQDHVLNTILSSDVSFICMNLKNESPSLMHIEMYESDISAPNQELFSDVSDYFSVFLQDFLDFIQGEVNLDVRRKVHDHYQSAGQKFVDRAKKYKDDELTPKDLLSHSTARDTDSMEVSKKQAKQLIRKSMQKLLMVPPFKPTFPNIVYRRAKKELVKDTSRVDKTLAHRYAYLLAAYRFFGEYIRCRYPKWTDQARELEIRCIKPLKKPSPYGSRLRI